MKEHILVVDDEQEIADLLEIYLSNDGYIVHKFYNGKKALQCIDDTELDLAILDVMLPDIDGFHLCQTIRQSHYFPIIMLTARGEEYDKVRGFELDIDDYVVKPFSVKELMMRINAILKRVNKYKKNADEYGELKLDYLAHKVTIGNKDVELSPKEYSLLFLLANNRNIVLSREKIIEEVWGYDYEGDDRTLDTHIKLLRKNLGEYKDCIVTVRGVGYRFEYKE